MADVKSLVKALKDMAVTQYSKGAPYRNALASALKGDMGGLQELNKPSPVMPNEALDVAMTFAPMGITKNPYFKEDVVEGFGKVISSPHGKISILSNNPHSPKTHSITEFFIDESKRGKGYGKELIDETLKQYPSDIGAQVSSPASAKAFYSKGFRLASNPNAKIDDIFKDIEDYSSAYMIK